MIDNNSDIRLYLSNIKIMITLVPLQLTKLCQCKTNTFSNTDCISAK